MNAFLLKAKTDVDSWLVHPCRTHGPRKAAVLSVVSGFGVVRVDQPALRTWRCMLHCWKMFQRRVPMPCVHGSDEKQVLLTSWLESGMCAFCAENPRILNKGN